MNFTRETLVWNVSDPDPAMLCEQLIPGRWMIEAGFQPPSCHDPAQLPLGDAVIGALALSLSTATVLNLNPGPALIDRLATLGLTPGPLVGLALHELIVNAVIHGNLQVGSGRFQVWRDILQRQSAIAQALMDPSRAARVVTIAIGWNASQIVTVIADEGTGYDSTTTPAPARASGRGLRLARMVGHLDVRRGGRETVITVKLPSLVDGP